MPSTIIERILTTPPDMVMDITGAVVDGEDYKLSAPIAINEPLVVTAPNGDFLSWKPSDLVYKDSDGLMDYIIGSSPDTLSVSGKVARYSRSYPFAADVFQAQEGQVKHWTVLDQAPRPPADYLGSWVLFGVSGIVDGTSLSRGNS